MNVERFAQQEYRDHIVYQELERTEPVPEFKDVLRELMKHEFKDFSFWLELSPKKDFRVGAPVIAGYRLMRRVLGLTFTVRFLERHERRMIREYAEFARRADPELRERVNAAIDHASQHERHLISQIDEERVRFIGNIVLGINDALISISGALTGLAFALESTHEVGKAGLITGAAASMSIAASAYLQARYQKGRDAQKAALYSGAAFLAVVLILTAPFFAFPAAGSALGAMAAAIAVLIFATSSYTTIVFERVFLRQLGTMVVFSVGTAAIAFLVGSFVNGG